MSENRFKAYVEKYSQHHCITEEEALKHRTVQIVKEYYDEIKTSMEGGSSFGTGGKAQGRTARTD